MKNLKEFWLYFTGIILFIKELILHPVSVGAAWPSTKRLAMAMAEQIQLPNTGFIIELGAGTGMVTKALLDHGIDENHLLVIERSKALCQHLRSYFPSLKIINGNAAQLKQLLQINAEEISAVISSLPLRILPHEMVTAIYEQIQQVLPVGGLYIQYTYHVQKQKVILPGFKLLKQKQIWLNFPPARVDVFQKEH